jgi:hypothetical protein
MLAAPRGHLDPLQPPGRREGPDAAQDQKSGPDAGAATEGRPYKAWIRPAVTSSNRTVPARP